MLFHFHFLSTNLLSKLLSDPIPLLHNGEANNTLDKYVLTLNRCRQLVVMMSLLNWADSPEDHSHTLRGWLQRCEKLLWTFYSDLQALASHKKSVQLHCLFKVILLRCSRFEQLFSIY